MAAGGGQGQIRINVSADTTQAVQQLQNLSQQIIKIGKAGVIDPSTVRKISTEFSSLNTSVINLGRGFQTTSRSMKEAIKLASEEKQKMTLLILGLKQVGFTLNVTGVALQGFGDRVIRTFSMGAKYVSDMAIQIIRAKVEMQALGDLTEQQVEQIFEYGRRFARETPGVSLLDFINAARRGAALGVPMARIPQMTRGLMAATGGDRELMERAMVQLAQFRTTGLYLDLRQAAQSAPLIFRAMREAYGMGTTGDIRVKLEQLRKEGVSSVEIFNKILEALDKRAPMIFEKLSQTAVGALERIRDTWEQLFTRGERGIGQVFLKAITPAILVFDRITQKLVATGNELINLESGVEKFAAKVTALMEALEPYLNEFLKRIQELDPELGQFYAIIMLIIAALAKLGGALFLTVGPFLSLLGGIAGLVAASGGVLSFFGSLLATLPFVAALFTGLGVSVAAFSRALQGLREAPGWAKDLSLYIRQLKLTVAAATQSSAEFSETLKESLLPERFKERFRELNESIENFKEALGKLIDRIVDMVNIIGRGFGLALDSFFSKFKREQKEGIPGFIDVMTKLVEVFTIFLKAVPVGLIESLAKAFSFLGLVLAPLIVLFEKLIDFINFLNNLFGGIPGRVIKLAYALGLLVIISKNVGAALQSIFFGAKVTGYGGFIVALLEPLKAFYSEVAKASNSLRSPIARVQELKRVIDEQTVAVAAAKAQYKDFVKTLSRIPDVHAGLERVLGRRYSTLGGAKIALARHMESIAPESEAVRARLVQYLAPYAGGEQRAREMVNTMHALKRAALEGNAAINAARAGIMRFAYGMEVASGTATRLQKLSFIFSAAWVRAVDMVRGAMTAFQSAVAAVGAFIRANVLLLIIMAILAIASWWERANERVKEHQRLIQSVSDAYKDLQARFQEEVLGLLTGAGEGREELAKRLQQLPEGLKKLKLEVPEDELKSLSQSIEDLVKILRESKGKITEASIQRVEDVFMRMISGRGIPPERAGEIVSGAGLTEVRKGILDLWEDIRKEFPGPRFTFVEGSVKDVFVEAREEMQRTLTAYAALVRAAGLPRITYIRSIREAMAEVKRVVEQTKEEGDKEALYQFVYKGELQAIFRRHLVLSLLRVLQQRLAPEIAPKLPAEVSEASKALEVEAGAGAVERKPTIQELAQRFRDILSGLSKHGKVAYKWGGEFSTQFFALFQSTRKTDLVIKELNDQLSDCSGLVNAWFKVLGLTYKDFGLTEKITDFNTSVLYNIQKYAQKYEKGMELITGDVLVWHDAVKKQGHAVLVVGDEVIEMMSRRKGFVVTEMSEFVKRLQGHQWRVIRTAVPAMTKGVVSPAESIAGEAKTQMAEFLKSMYKGMVEDAEYVFDFLPNTFISHMQTLVSLFKEAGELSEIIGKNIFSAREEVDALIKAWNRGLDVVSDRVKEIFSAGLSAETIGRAQGVAAPLMASFGANIFPRLIGEIGFFGATMVLHNFKKKLQNVIGDAIVDAVRTSLDEAGKELDIVPEAFKWEAYQRNVDRMKKLMVDVLSAVANDPDRKKAVMDLFKAAMDEAYAGMAGWLENQFAQRLESLTPVSSIGEGLIDSIRNSFSRELDKLRDTAKLREALSGVLYLISPQLAADRGIYVNLLHHALEGRFRMAAGLTAELHNFERRVVDVQSRIALISGLKPAQVFETPLEKLQADLDQLMNNLNNIWDSPEVRLIRAIFGDKTAFGLAEAVFVPNMEKRIRDTISAIDRISAGMKISDPIIDFLFGSVSPGRRRLTKPSPEVYRNELFRMRLEGLRKTMIGEFQTLLQGGIPAESALAALVPKYAKLIEVTFANLRDFFDFEILAFDVGDSIKEGVRSAFDALASGEAPWRSFIEAFGNALKNAVMKFVDDWVDAMFDGLRQLLFKQTWAERALGTGGVMNVQGGIWGVIGSIIQSRAGGGKGNTLAAALGGLIPRNVQGQARKELANALAESAMGLSQILAAFLGAQVAGGGTGAVIGSTLGASIGGMLGPQVFASLGAFGGPIGAIVGGLLGGFLGGLFGGRRRKEDELAKRRTELLNRIEQHLRPVSDYFRTYNREAFFGPASAHFGGRIRGYGFSMTVGMM
jgi:hypothetical protein